MGRPEVTKRRCSAALPRIVLILVPMLLASCGGSEEGKIPVSGSIRIDGSSTVFPISQAVAEEFSREYRGARISLGQSGTGGGFEKFCTGETQINDASRAIKDEEEELCRSNGIEYTEFSVAADGLSIIVHPDNDWVDCLTVEQLHEMWRPESPIDRWSDLDPSWPDKDLNLYGPGTDSGTFDYFTDTINDEEGASRSDYSASEDDNVLIQGVEGDKYALAYLGFAYYYENRERLKIVPVDGGNGCVEPTPDTIRANTYAPLSRPLYVYVANNALAEVPDDPAVPIALAEFLRYYLTKGAEIIPFVGYVPFEPTIYTEQVAKLEALTQ